MSERIEVQRTIAAPAADIFAVLCDPQGHVAIDARDAAGRRGRPGQAVGDSFVVHMDREALNDFPLGKYDVTVDIRDSRRTADRLDDPGPDPAPDRPRLRLPARADRRRHRRHLVLRLVGHRPAVARSRHLPVIPRARCGRRWESSTARCGAATSAASSPSRPRNCIPLRADSGNALRNAVSRPAKVRCRRRC